MDLLGFQGVRCVAEPGTLERAHSGHHVMVLTKSVLGFVPSPSIPPFFGNRAPPSGLRWVTYAPTHPEGVLVGPVACAGPTGALPWGVSKSNWERDSPSLSDHGAFDHECNSEHTEEAWWLPHVPLSPPW